MRWDKMLSTHTIAAALIGFTDRQRSANKQFRRDAKNTISTLYLILSRRAVREQYRGEPAGAFFQNIESRTEIAWSEA
jgi:hypothetical protein